MNQNSLLDKSIFALFFSFVLPSVISEVLVGVQGIVDGIFVGNFINANAMSSINIASPFTQFILGCTMVVSTGTVSYLGRSLGENDLEKSQNSFHSAFIGLGCFALFFTFAGVFFAKPIALFLGASDVLMKDTILYIRVLSFFIPSIAYMLLFGFVDRLLGKPKYYLFATFSCLITNVFADFIFIKVLNLNVGGAALATGLAYFSGLLITIWPIISRHNLINIYNGHFCKNIFNDILINGSSEGVSYVSTAITIFLFNSAFMYFAGESGIAAFAIMSYIGNFTALIMFGVSDGIVSIVSTNYGAQKFNRVRKTFYIAALINFIAGIICFLFLKFNNRSLISAFLDADQDVIELAVNGSFYYGISFLFVGFNILQSGFNTAVGNAFESLLISGCRGFVFNFIGIMIFPRFLKLLGVWITFPFSEFSTVIVCLLIMLHKPFLYFKRRN